MTFLNGTNIRTHHQAAGAKKGPLSKSETIVKALGRSRGGDGTKVCVIADGHGKAFGFALGPGQAHELPLAPAMLDNLTAIPAKRHAGPVAYPKWVYRCRHLVENFWARLKEWRAVATRYEKTATSFLAVIHIAAAVNWIKL